MTVFTLFPALRSALPVLFVLASNWLAAQNSTCLTLHIGEASGVVGDTVLVPIEVDGFNKAISLQFALGWDATQLELVGVDLGANPLKLDANFNLGLSVPGQVRCSWFDVFTSSLPNETKIFTLRLLIKKAPPLFSPITIFQSIGFRYEVILDNAGAFVPQSLIYEAGGVHTNGKAASPMRLTNMCGKAVACTDKSGFASYEIKGGQPPFIFQWQGPNGFFSQSATLSNLAPGEYKVTVTDQSGNTAVGINNLFKEPNKIGADVTVQASICNQGGCATIKATGGQKPYSINWGDSTNTSLARCGLAEGSYKITVSDNWGCSTEADFKIDPDPVAIKYTAVVQNVDCAKNEPGAITITPSGSLTNLQYRWSNGDTTASITQLQGGFYTVTITSTNGCEEQDTFEVTQLTNWLLKTETNVQPKDSLLSIVLLISQTASNPVYPVKVYWSFGRTVTLNDWPLNGVLDSLVSVPLGYYDAIVEDANGCKQKVVSSSIPLAKPPVASFKSSPWIYIGDDAPQTPNGCTGVYIRNFKGVTKAQFSITWDTTKVLYANVKSLSLFNLKAGNFTANNDAVVVNWASLNNQPITLPDDSRIFEVCFTAKDTSIAEAKIQFSGKYISNSTFVDKNLRNLGFIGKNGIAFFKKRSTTPDVICDYGLVLPSCDRQLITAFTLSWCGATQPLTDLKVFNSNNIELTNINFDRLTVGGYRMEGKMLDGGLYVYVAADNFDYTKCVWPGDVDHNNVCNVYDFVYLGLGFGANAPALQRFNPSISWTGQEAESWPVKKGWYILKDQDTDGNGKINPLDTMAVLANWGKQVPDLIGYYASPFDFNTGWTDPKLPYIPMFITPDTLKVDTRGYLPIEMGSTSTLVDSIHGFAFAILYDNKHVAPDIRFEAFPCWMGKPGTDFFVFQRNNINLGRLDVAIIRPDSNNMKGYGAIGNLRIKVNSSAFNAVDPTTEVVHSLVSLYQPLAMVHSSRRLNIDAQSALIPVKRKITISVNNPQLAGRLSIQPNPASDRIQLNWPGAHLQTAQIISATGGTVREQQLNHISTATMDVHGLPAGTYWVRAVTDKGVAVNQIVIQ